MNKLSEIIEQRAREYGSFKENIDTLSVFYNNPSLRFFKNGIEIVDIDKEDYIFKFAKTMLGLKLIRSITASGDVYLDCLMDFKNYERLFYSYSISDTLEIKYHPEIFSEEVTNCKNLSVFENPKTSLVNKKILEFLDEKGENKVHNFSVVMLAIFGSSNKEKVGFEVLF